MQSQCMPASETTCAPLSDGLPGVAQQRGVAHESSGNRDEKDLEGKESIEDRPVKCYTCGSAARMSAASLGQNERLKRKRKGGTQVRQTQNKSEGNKAQFQGVRPLVLKYRIDYLNVWKARGNSLRKRG